MKALQSAGFQTVVVGNRPYDFLRYGWLAGNRIALDWWDFGPQEDREWVDRQISCHNTLHEWLNLQYDGVHVGRFTIASALRSFKVGQLNFTDLSVQASLRKILESSIGYSLAGARLLQEIKPDLVLVMDRGYSGYGEVFDVALNQVSIQ